MMANNFFALRGSFAALLAAVKSELIVISAVVFVIFTKCEFGVYCIHLAFYDIYLSQSTLQI